MAPASHAWFLVAAMALALVSAPAQALAGDPRTEAVQFSLADLGTLGGIESHASFINKQGQVAGDSLTPTGEKHAFLWENGAMRDLGTLEGNQSAVAGLNDRGQVVGSRTLASGATHAFLWTDGVMLDLGTLPGGDESRSQAVNNRGQVVGWSEALEGTHAFLWDDGVMTDLGTLGGFWSYGVAINDAGQVAGNSYTAQGEQHAFLWADGRMTDLTTVAGGPPCDCFASVLGLNARGQVVGIESRFVPVPPPRYSTIITDAILWDGGTRRLIAAGDDSTYYRAARLDDRGEVSGNRIVVGMFGMSNPFYWRDGRLQEWNLGGSASTSTAMNRYGQVVGEGRTLAGELHGFSWSAGRLTDLGRPSTSAADVNEHGVVAGSAYFPNRGTHAALWTPTGRVAPRVVPELSGSAQ